MANGLPYAGIPYGTDAFYRVLESEFPVSDFRPADKLPSNMREAPPAASDTYATEPAMPAAIERPQYDGPPVSAPPSRETTSYSGERAPLSPSSIRLSREQLEIARASGLTPVQYARNLLELQRRRDAGELQQDR